MLLGSGACTLSDPRAASAAKTGMARADGPAVSPAACQRPVPPSRGLLAWVRGVAQRRAHTLARDTDRALEDVRREVGGVSQATEGVFLLVGERLMGVQLRAAEVARHTCAIAALLSNDAGSLAKVEEELRATCEDRQDDGLVGFVREIQENARWIHQAVQGIGPVVRSFDVLGVMTRIESSRFALAGAAFSGLADAVTSLSGQIRSQMATTGAAAAALLATSSEAAEQIQTVARKHQENLGPLTRQASAELLKIGERRRRAAEAAQILGSRYEGVSRSVGDLVMALQAHDIVRQQLEHVVEALGRREIPAANVGATARLQAAQLEHSRATFENSARQIREALCEIERNIGGMAEESSRLLGISGAAEASFFTGVEADLTAILAILDSNETAARRLAETAVSVRRSVAEIAETTAGVQAVGLEMQRIALNATIQAARLGPDGGALEVVSHSIRALASETESASGTLESHLKPILDAITELSSIAEAEGCQTRTGELRISTGALGSIQEKAQQDHAKAVDLAEQLTEEIRSTVAAFGTQDECLRVLADAIEVLRKVAAEATEADSGPAEEMPAVYTMQSERAVHEALYQAAPDGDDAAAQGAAPAPEDDNVEFF